MFLPEIIYQKLAISENKGSFEAATMFLDIKGFTRITEELSKYGEEGAEIVSSILNQVFSPIVRIIHSNGGFIATFAGDAITVIYPDKPTTALTSASQIQQCFQEFSRFETRFGHFAIKSSTGLSFGHVEWGIIGDGELLHYYFRGAGISGAISTASKSGSDIIIFDKQLFEKIEHNEIKYSEYNKNYFKLESMLDDKSDSNCLIAECQPLRDNDVEARFYPIDDIPETLIGEFRDVISIFISFSGDLEKNELKTFASKIRKKTNEYGGYFNVLDFGDKGGIILIVFGAPLTFENAIDRACNFLLSIKSEGLLADKRTGIELGRVYSGILGSNQRGIYTVIGDSVNTAARIMQHTPIGSIYAGYNIQSKADGYVFSPKEKIHVKGKKVEVVPFELQSKRKIAGIDKKPIEFLVGRTRELQKLSELLVPVLSGKNGHIVAIYGNPGIGKSRFVQEFCYKTRESTQSIYLKADSILKKSFHPFNSFFRDFFSYPKTRIDFDRSWSAFLNKMEKIPDALTADIKRELSRTMSFIAALIGIFWSNSDYELSDAQTKYENTISAIKAFIKAQSLLKPLIIVLDDFQWFDDESKQVVKNMLINVDNFPFITFILSRYSDKGEKYQLDTIDTKISEIDLQQLDENDQQDLIAMKIGCNPSSKLSTFIKNKTEGNPFYIEQYCMYLKEKKLLVDINDQCDLKKNIDVEIPEGIRNVIVARIDRLSQKLKIVVQQASVLGDEVDVNVLSFMLKETTVDLLLKKGEEREIWLCIHELLYLFKHVILREAAYSMLLKSRLRHLHELAAESLEKLYGDVGEKWADIAYHFEFADNRQKAKEFIRKAAAWAKENYRNQEALELFTKLLSYTYENDDYDVILEISELYELTGEWEKAQHQLEEYIAKAEMLGHELSLAELTSRLGLIHNNKGNYDQAIEYFNRACSIFTKQTKWVLVANAHCDIGTVFDNRSEYSKAMNSYRKALEQIQKTVDKKIKAVILNNIGVVYYKLGDFELALEYQLKALKIKKNFNNKRSESDTLHNIGNIYSRRGDIEKALSYYHKALEISEEIGDKCGAAITLNNIGSVFLDSSDYKQALQYFEKSIVAIKELGDQRSEATILCNIGLIYNRIGEQKNALQNFNQALIISQKINDQMGDAAAYGGLGLVYIELKKYDLAMEKFKQSLEIRRNMGDIRGIGLSIKNIGVTYYHQHKFQDALESFNEAFNLFTEIQYQLGLGTVLEKKGDLFLQLNRKDEAIQLYSEAVEVFRKMQFSHNEQLIVNKIKNLQQK